MIDGLWWFMMIYDDLYTVFEMCDIPSQTVK